MCKNYSGRLGSIESKIREVRTRRKKNHFDNEINTPENDSKNGDRKIERAFFRTGEWKL